MRKTKIICTLGPSTDSDERVEELIRAGMDVARFNFSHQTYPEHQARFERLVRIREKLGVPVAALLDTKGPEVRLGLIEGGQAELITGELFTLTTRSVLGNSKCASVSFQDLPKDVKPGDRILIDDGLIELVLLENDGENLVCQVLNGGRISDRKGINVPNVSLSMPFLSERDREDILFGIRTGFDFIAASFTRTADDIRQIKKLLEENGGRHIQVIAKIENLQGVENIDEIISVADGVMVARGDMGVEISYENIPVLQKRLINKAYDAGKVVITATQMLDSMMKHPRPTRAEITDVANAIYDGTSRRLSDRVGQGHGDHRRADRGGYQLRAAFPHPPGAAHPRRHQRHLPRDGHDGPRLKGQVHRHRHQIRQDGPDDLQIPAALPHRRLLAA